MNELRKSINDVRPIIQEMEKFLTIDDKGFDSPSFPCLTLYYKDVQSIINFYKDVASHAININTPRSHKRHS